MKASERLERRNELVVVLNQVDSDIQGAYLAEDPKLFGEAIGTRRSIVSELNALGFEAPELDIDGRSVDEAAAVGAAGGTGDTRPVSVVAKRRIEPAPETG